MSLIEGVGDEVTHFFIILFTAVVAYIAWWSTSISEQRHFRTVLLLDRRRQGTRSIFRVRVPPRQLTNHTETVTISEGSSLGSSSNSTTSVQTEGSSDSTLLTETDSVNAQASSAEPKSDILPSQSSTSQAATVEGVPSVETSEESVNVIGLEESDIIETMDADTQNEVRRRRLAHFEGASGYRNDINNSQQPAVNQLAHSGDLPNVNDDLESKVENEESSNFNTDQQRETSNTETLNEIDDNITIKLKYINDEIKVVDGRLEELLGDFKRRHFVDEINTNKIVKLIFNGQVLKQDRNSLQSCGLFDNCVVHCLIHQKRPSLSSRDQAQSDNVNEPNQQFLRDNPFVTNDRNNVNNNNQGVDWDLGSFLCALLSFVLAAAWYFRFAYGHLYTMTATVGLIIITVVFLVILLGAYFPDSEIPDANLRIRVTRTERIEVQ